MKVSDSDKPTKRRDATIRANVMRFAAHPGLVALVVFTFASVVIATGCGSDTDGTGAGTTGPTTDTLPEWVADVPLRVEISPPGAWDGAIKEEQAIAAARKRFHPGEQPPQKPIAIPVRAPAQSS